jgi:EAL domain-containing protein (putative c-di-GMP-specific phosphodiesterase class I)
MYRAKGTGRARYELFSDEMHEHALRRLRLEGALRQAADRSELALLFQPIVALASEQLAGFEALVRWRRNGVLVPPADFIPVAEETGVIRSIGGQVLRDACRQAAAWQERRPAHPGAAVSVNISPRQLADPHMVASVARALEEMGADPARLRLELTETALMADHHAAVRTCNELTALGVSLVLDDFGTGFSSLSHLGRYPIDTVKIDRSFVADLTVDPGARGIVAAVLTMAAGFGARVVAEGVERPEQARLLREMGCDMAQGYLFSRPVPVEDAGLWLDAGPSVTAA